MKKIICLLSLIWLSAPRAEDLLQLYQLAKQKDPVLKEAAAQLEASQQIKPLARSALLPHIGLSAGANYNYEKTILNRDKNFGSTQIGINLSQTVYRRDQWIQLEQADWQLDLAKEQYRQQEQDLILRLATAYFGVLSAQASLTFVQMDKKAIARQLEQAKQRFNVGLIPITGVHEAQSRYDQAMANEIVAMNSLDNAWEDLREIIGIRPIEINELKDKIELAPPQPNSIEKWSEMGLANNPAIRSASNATQIAQKEIEVQRSGHYPTVDLNAYYNTYQTDSNERLDVDSGAIGLSLNLPLYTGGAVTAATRQARSNLIAAQERLDQARRSVSKEVQNAYRRVIASISTVKALKAAIISNKSALDAVKAGFDVGARTMVDVLNAQRDYYRALSDHANARFIYILSLLQLKRAAGVLNEKDIAQINQLLK